jgi:hypothetical protein
MGVFGVPCSFSDSVKVSHACARCVSGQDLVQDGNGGRARGFLEFLDPHAREGLVGAKIATLHSDFHIAQSASERGFAAQP